MKKCWPILHFISTISKNDKIQAQQIYLIINFKNNDE